MAPRKKKELQVEILNIQISELRQYYMPLNLDETHRTLKKRALKKLVYILNHTNNHRLQGANFHYVLQCSLITLYYFGMHMILFSASFKDRFSSRLSKLNYLNAEYAFSKSIELLLPDKIDETIKIVLTFFGNLDLWPYESFVIERLKVVIFFSHGKATLYDCILNDVHVAVLQDVNGAKHRMRVLYELIRSQAWAHDEMQPFVVRVLDAYFQTIDDQSECDYAQLRKSFEICLRRIFERVDNNYRLMMIKSMMHWLHSNNISTAELEDISSLLEYFAELNKAGPYEESYNGSFLEDIMNQFVKSSDHSFSLVGCILLHRFLDRHQNSTYLKDPFIYYEFAQANVRIGRYTSSDEEFIWRHREQIHDSMLAALKLHGGRLPNMKAVCKIICCTIVEVPCGLTAAAAACLVIDIQEFALNDYNLPHISRYWMHGVVAAVLSLICWVHKAPILSQYVHSIIGQRAKEAPQLNPPLLLAYNIEQHVAWIKPTLLFEDWELRYGLWKHFQNAQNVSTNNFNVLDF